jgi:hypothetical protein
MLDLVDEAFDEVALFVKMFVVGRLFTASGEPRDHSIGAEREIGPDLVSVVCLVGNDVLSGEAVDQGLCLRAVMSLAGREDEA